MSQEVAGVWNPPLEQKHPDAWYETPNAPGGRAVLLPASSNVMVDLKFVPKKRGLFRHRTYDMAFKAEYVFINPTRIPQTMYFSFPLPAGAEKLEGFEFRMGVDRAGDLSARRFWCGHAGGGDTGIRANHLARCLSDAGDRELGVWVS